MAKTAQKKTAVKKNFEPEYTEIYLLGDVILSYGGGASVRLKRYKPEAPDIIKMASEFLRAATDVSADEDGCVIIDNFADLRDYLIKILEEKFGLTIKTCENCNFFVKKIYGGPDGQSAGCGRQGEDNILRNYHPYNCEANGFEDIWVPKEIPSEKKSKR